MPSLYALIVRNIALPPYGGWGNASVANCYANGKFLFPQPAGGYPPVGLIIDYAINQAYDFNPNPTSNYSSTESALNANMHGGLISSGGSILWVDLNQSPPITGQRLYFPGNGAIHLLSIPNSDSFLAFFYNSGMYAVRVNFGQSGTIVTGTPLGFSNITKLFIWRGLIIAVSTDAGFVMMDFTGKLLVKRPLPNANAGCSIYADKLFYHSTSSTALTYIDLTSPYAAPVNTGILPSGLSGPPIFAISDNLLVYMSSAFSVVKFLAAYDITNLLAPIALTVPINSQPNWNISWLAADPGSPNLITLNGGSYGYHTTYMLAKQPILPIVNAGIQREIGPVPLTRLRNLSKVYPFFGRK